MICIARTLGVPVSVPAGNAARMHVPRAELGAHLAADLAHDVHHVRVALDLHAHRELHRAGLRDAADVVAREIDEHHVLGELFGIGEELLGEGDVFGGVRAAAARAGEGPHRHRSRPRRAPASRATRRRSGAPGTPRFGRKIDEVHVRRRGEHAQRAVDVEGIGAAGAA